MLDGQWVTVEGQRFVGDLFACVVAWFVVDGGFGRGGLEWLVTARGSIALQI